MPIHDWTLVDAGIFHDFHGEWITAIKHALNRGMLPADFYALTEQVAGGLHPDVLTLQYDRPSSALSAGIGDPTTSANGGVRSTATLPQVRFTATVEPGAYTQKRRRIVIRHSSDDEVVAVIEIVSPGNKASRHGIRSFVEKTLELLDAGIHLLILDLFPPGRRDPQGIHALIWSELSDDSFQLPDDKRLTLVAYSAGTARKAFIEPVAVGDLLPQMPLFLEPEKYVSVPLEATYQAAFDEVPRRWRDVLQPPAP